ncbi:NAD-dependent epimerase/dehydratase family protein [Arenibacterium halophilum]|uniref:NAD(P)-dependent oxidoreductase n=1 Tax=Arenibacterium halophilum TaxID=2583821 RepID=A0ABY2X6W7_9RHOB|nr:NAD(P)-dependent oxidoreductase [Arenibacterium halophilum]TMV11527.1 NAD(P)-dependent oxidoreductase [Arenibacterium halophilum]
MKKIVLTGAAGALGHQLRAPLAAMADQLVSTDLADAVEGLAGNETYVKADLGDAAAVMDLLEGAEMVVHFGAIGDEAPFEQILHSNFLGAYNVWNAAQKHGVRRIVYASSIHAMGMYPKTTRIDTKMPHRPDTFYGLSKCFAEDMASMYWDKYGIEAVCLRIYSASGPVGNARALGSWLSYDDLIQLVQRSIDTPITGFTVVYGVSNNDRSPVDNSAASFLGYRPKDNAEDFAEAILAQTPQADPQDKAQMCHGGPFATVPLGESGVAYIKKMSVS